MSELDDLIAAKAAADAALASAEDGARRRLLAAKEALRDNPDDEDAKAEKAEAVAEMQAVRGVLREGRQVTAVGGDAVASQGGEG